jgi:benzodiazapine receptor
MLNRESWLSLVPFLTVCFAAAGIGSLATRGSLRTWYSELRKPDWNPPNWVFGPIWTILYAMMALSAWLVWREVGWAGAKFALLLFAVQLALNTAWSVVFFGMHAIGAAFAEILLLWMMIIATTVAFCSLSFLAGWLLLPYIVWIAFASYLNFRIWQMN